MKQGYIIFIFFALASCNYFDVKKTSSEAILNEELKTFNWSDVDVYPTFDSCNGLTSKEALKQCFQNTLTQFITSSLQNESITVNQDINDTINISFQISDKGKLSLLGIKLDSLTEAEIPNMKLFIKNSIDSMPKIYPALKRGQQVKTEFKLPVIIQVH